MNVIVSNKYQMLLADLNIDVIKNINGVFTVEDLVVQFKNFFYNKMILDITAVDGYEDINTIQRLSVALDMNKVILLLDDSPVVNSSSYLSSLVSMGIYNFTKNVDQISFLIDNPNSYKDVASYHQLNINMDEASVLNDRKQINNNNFIGQRIIGVRNLTEHAGSTTFTYILKKHIERLYKVKAVETETNNFAYFNDKDLSSISSFELKEYINENVSEEVLLIDLNSDDGEGYCTEVIYLVEPGIIPLNKLIDRNSMAFEKVKSNKIVLNKSVLSQGDVTDFEREAGVKVFYNIPLIDDKEDDIKIINEFLIALGFSRFSNEEKKGGFSLFH